MARRRKTVMGASETQSRLTQLSPMAEHPVPSGATIRAQISSCEPAVAQKSGGVLKISFFDNPASMKKPSLQHPDKLSPPRKSKMCETRPCVSWEGLSAN